MQLFRRTSNFNTQSINKVANGLNREGSNQIALYTKNNSRLYVNSTGNVGIATNNPQYKLHINGQLYVQDIATFNGGLNINDLTVSGNFTVLGETTTIDSTTVSVDDSLIRLADNNPADIIDIGFYGMYIDGGVTKFTGIYRDSSEKKMFWFAEDTVEPTETHEIENPYVTVDTSSGYVGIGLTEPSYVLDVNGAAQVKNDLIVQGDLHIKGASSDGFSDLGNIWGSNNSGDTYHKNINNNVSIGITDATNKLTVHGDIGVSGAIVPLVNEEFDLGATGARFRDLYLSNDTIFFADKAFTVNESGLQVDGQSAGGVWTDSGSLIYYDGGNVGIGTDNPSEIFQVYRDGVDRFNIAADGDFNINPARNFLFATNYASINNVQMKIDTTEFAASASLNIIDETDSTLLGFSHNGSTGNITSDTGTAISLFSSVVRFEQPIDMGSGVNIVMNNNNITGAGTISGSSLTLQSDTSTPLIFNTNGATETMRINSSGHVGIGTTSPDTSLHLHEASSGSNYIKFTNTDADNSFVGLDANEVLRLHNSEARDIAFYTNNLERIRINSSGQTQFFYDASYDLWNGGSLGNVNTIFGNRNTSSQDTRIFIVGERGGQSTNGVVIGNRDNTDATDSTNPQVSCAFYGTNASDQQSGYATIHTSSDGQTLTERMRISSDGEVTVANTHIASSVGALGCILVDSVTISSLISNNYSTSAANSLDLDVNSTETYAFYKIVFHAYLPHDSGGVQLRYRFIDTSGNITTTSGYYFNIYGGNGSSLVNGTNTFGVLGVGESAASGGAVISMVGSVDLYLSTTNYACRMCGTATSSALNGDNSNTNTIGTGLTSVAVLNTRIIGMSFDAVNVDSGTGQLYIRAYRMI